MQATDYVRSLWKFIHMLSMIRTGITLILGHGIKGQGQLWYFCLWNLIGPKQISLYAPAWMVRRGVYYM